MRRLLLAATAAIAFTSSAAHASKDGYHVLGNYGSWNLSMLTFDDPNMTAVCEVDQLIQRIGNASKTGYVLVTSLTLGGAWIMVGIEDWQIVDGRDYGRIIVSVDNVSWYAVAKGSGTDGVSLEIAGADGDDFWQAFQAGVKFQVAFPNDSLTVPLTGSRAAFQAMQDCYRRVSGSTGKRDPFNGSTSPTSNAKRNPFTSL